MRAALERYCREHVGSFGKYDSAPILQCALLDTIENLFGIPETEAPKVILYRNNTYANWTFFEDAIAGALTRYRNTQRQTATTKAYSQERFEIPDTRPYNSAVVQRCFYVDFIIRLKNGTIGLFDTKTSGSDPDTPEKNNALWQYVEEHRAKGKKMTGGVLVQVGDSWYYPAGLIDDDKTTDDWSRLDLATL